VAWSATPPEIIPHYFQDSIRARAHTHTHTHTHTGACVCVNAYSELLLWNVTNTYPKVKLQKKLIHLWISHLLVIILLPANSRHAASSIAGQAHSVVCFGNKVCSRNYYRMSTQRQQDKTAFVAVSEA
jgi:hypothetical protein